MSTEVAADVRTVEVGIGPVTPDDLVAVARQGAAVRLADGSLAEIARTRAVIEGLADDVAAALRHLDRLRRARHPAHPAAPSGPSCSAA